MLREGVRKTVYKDTLGHPTVGIGHLVRPEDNLEVGDVITQERIRFFYEQDVEEALDAALDQAEYLGHNKDIDFIVALVSVNFQLGVGWARKFRNTYASLKEGNYDKAIYNLKRSLWFKQTPVRVEDFIDAIKKLKEKKRKDNV